jgi:hypothetical protein
MKSGKIIGLLFLAGAFGVLVPYTLLTIIFQYPDVLRLDAAVILTRFHDGGQKLVLTWFLFAIGGLPLFPAYILLGKTLERNSLASVATTIGITGLVVQVIGLLRWTFVIPVISQTYATAVDEVTKAAAVMSFKTIHQFAGVLLGEHLGQLFTVTWTILMSVSLYRTGLISKWTAWFGYGSAFIYLMAQAELLATVMPGIPVWEMAGFIGSTLWLVWLVVVAITFIRSKRETSANYIDKIERALA